MDEAVAAANDGDTIQVLKDCTTEGLNLSKNLIFDGGETKPTITFNKEGIALWGKSLTFKNCKVMMNGIGSTPYTAEWNWQTICASKDASLTLENTEMTLNGEKADGTKVNNNVHAIYFCSNNKLNLTNSTLKISNYPQDALEWDGGDGGYNVNLTDSTFISDNNRSGFTGTFYATIDNSTVKVLNSAGNGSNGSHFEFIDSFVDFNNNGAHGLSAGNLTISDSTVNANGNGGNGIHVTGALEISNDSNVTISENQCTISSKWTIPGALYIAGKSEIADSTVTITGNKGSGIYQKSDTLTVDPSATLTITNNEAEKLGYGGGVYVNGTMSLPKNVILYNNHARTAGDDIYSTGTIAFAKVGSGWVLDDCDHMIDGWYDDAEGQRWSVHAEPEHVEEFARTETAETVKAPLALKAAHDLNPEDPLPTLLAGLWLNTNDHYSYLIGYSDGTVRPNGKITRAEVATIFFRLLDDDTRAKYWSSENNFSDVSADKWYNNAVSTLCNMGVIGGYADGTFRPDAPISRAEFAKIAVSFTQNNGSTTYNYFTDVKTTDWFAPYVTAAKDAGLIEGYSDGSFKPESKITRAEACAIVNRTLGRKPSKAHMKISDRIDWPDVQTTDWFYEAIMEATNSHTYQMGKRVETWNDKLPQRDWA
ncbi:MAG: S-layer homology domain-containing protein, partial [Oscillospiraceae bacterium]|nr:S-layer homology domain-containing protein [Clostridiales bacterium]MDY2718682.1 S-layer homology domain-containing protein [Oscillospiraceae bacterium]